MKAKAVRIITGAQTLFGSIVGLAPLLAAAAPVTFVDVAKQAGVVFRHTFGDDHMSSILESTGAGCAFLDADGDGHLDIYLVNGCYLPGISDEDSGEKDAAAKDQLFRNRGDGTFEDVTDRSGAGDPRFGMAVVCGDYDNDGDTDIYVTNYGRNTLYRNDGKGNFTDATEQAGVGCTLWSVGAVFLDYDGDGDLDLYVGNYLKFDPEYRLYYAADEFPGPLSYPGVPDVLYRNDGDGTFTDVTKEAGVVNKGRAMGVIAADFDDDGRTDIYVSNDAMEDYLYRNDGDGTFKDIGLEAGVAYSANGDSSASMGGEFGDYDNDGDLDLFVPDSKFNNLFRNAGRRMFEDVTARTGIAEISGQYTSWGGAFIDFDNDGDLDLFISNGSDHRLDTQENLLLENIPGPGDTRVFRDYARKGGEALLRKNVARGCAFGDYDDDGDLDILILCLDQPSRLLRNDGGNRNHWIQVLLKGTRSNRDGIGARVTIRADDLVQTTEKKTAASYLSQNDPRLHFGLGGRMKIDEITVRWPSGAVQTLKDIPADQVLRIEESKRER